MNNRCIKVLLVDDDITLGSIITNALNHIGHNVHYQSTPTAIETIIEEFMPNIILLDIDLGAENGIDIGKDIYEKFPRIPIIFISSHTDSSFVVNALGSGGVNYLKKPINIKELIAFITRYATVENALVTRLGIFTFNASNGILLNTKDNIKYSLTKIEYTILKLLIDNINQTVGRSVIENKIWASEKQNSKSLNNYILRIRQYLSKDTSVQIETRAGVGYTLTYPHKK